MVINPENISIIYRISKMINILFLLPFTLFAQDADNSSISMKSGTTGSIGTVTMNGQMYNQLSLRPEIPIGKLGIGLDIYLYFNDEGMYWESWNFSSGGSAYRTIIDKIYYIRWGHPEDNLYFMAGALPSVTLGEGILVYNYANIMEYPQVRQIGLNLQAKVAGIDIELIHSNLKVAAPGILGIRGSYSVFPKLSMGISLVTDLNQLAGLPDNDGDDYPDYYDYYPDDSSKWDDEDKWEKIYYSIPGADLDSFITWYEDSEFYNYYNPEEAESDAISGIALDAVHTLSEKITLYSQVGFLIGEIDTTMLNPTIQLEKKSLGTGWVPLGARVKLGPINLLAEYRMGSRLFIFNFWDQAYDLNRVIVVDSILTRESQLYKYGKLNGFYTRADVSVFNLFNFGVGYQNMKGEKWDENINAYKLGETNQTLLASVGIYPSLIPKVKKAEAFYQQSNVSNPFDFSPSSSTILGYDVGIKVSSGVMLMYQGRTTYISDLEKPGEFKPIKSIQIETQFII